MKNIALGLAISALMSTAAPTQAEIQTFDYFVTGAGTGKFVLDFNTATSTYSMTALDLTFDSVSFDLTSAFFIPLTGVSILGGLNGGVFDVLPGTPDFGFQFLPALESQTAFALYSNTGQPASAGRITISRMTAAVPEPSTWLMAIVGFGAIGATLRRGRLGSLGQQAIATRRGTATAGHLAA